MKFIELSTQNGMKLKVRNENVIPAKVGISPAYRYFLDSCLPKSDRLFIPLLNINLKKDLAYVKKVVDDVFS